MTNKKTFMTASFEICNSDVFHFVLYFCSLVSGLSNVSLQTKWLLMKYFITFLHLTNGGLMRQLSCILLPSAFCKDGTWNSLTDWKTFILENRLLTILEGEKKPLCQYFVLIENQIYPEKEDQNYINFSHWVSQ